MALPYAKYLPTGVRYLLHGLGSTEGTGASLLSYLLFDRRYTRALLDLGYRDAQGRIWFCGRKAHRVVTPQGTRFSVRCEGIFNASPKVLRSALGISVLVKGGAVPERDAERVV